MSIHWIGLSLGSIDVRSEVWWWRVFDPERQWKGPGDLHRADRNLCLGTYWKRVSLNHSFNIYSFGKLSFSFEPGTVLGCSVQQDRQDRHGPAFTESTFQRRLCFSEQDGFNSTAWTWRIRKGFLEGVMSKLNSEGCVTRQMERGEPGVSGLNLPGGIICYANQESAQ